MILEMMLCVHIKSGYDCRDDVSVTQITTQLAFSSSLRPGSKLFTCRKWIIGYNFAIHGGAELKFGTHKELIVLNILKYKYYLNKSRDTSRDQFGKNCTLLTNWWPV